MEVKLNLDTKKNPYINRDEYIQTIHDDYNDSMSMSELKTVFKKNLFISISLTSLLGIPALIFACIYEFGVSFKSFLYATLAIIIIYSILVSIDIFCYSRDKLELRNKMNSRLKSDMNLNDVELNKRFVYCDDRYKMKLLWEIIAEALYEKIEYNSDKKLLTIYLDDNTFNCMDIRQYDDTEKDFLLKIYEHKALNDRQLQNEFTNIIKRFDIDDYQSRSSEEIAELRKEILSKNNI